MLQYPPRGSILSVFCNSNNLVAQVADGYGDWNPVISEVNSPECGYKLKPSVKEIKMNKLIAVNISALADLAASSAEKQALAAFGLPVIHDAEIQAIMEEELAANRKEATRAAVKEIMAINSIADAELRAQFEAIRNANRAIAAARESAKNIALARAYGAETRDYIPLMMLLGAPISFDQRRSIPAEWLQANSEKVLAAFKEQGQAVAAAKKTTVRPAAKSAARK